MEAVLAGAFGGIVECAAVQPFDLLKTRFQQNSAGPNASVLQALRDIYHEGGVSRFYRGILPELTSMVPKSSVMFATYEATRCTLENQAFFGRGGMDVEFLCGIAAGGPEALAVTPFQVVKVRLQTKEHIGRYTNTAQCLSSVIREEGVSALTTGLRVTVCRNCAWNGVYFPTMYAFKQVFKKWDMTSDEHRSSGSRWQQMKQAALPTAITLVSGFAGGTLATCFNCPFDVVKSRIQAQVTDPTLGKQSLKYVHVWESLSTIAKEEGIQALYKGFAPKVIRMGIGGGVAMASFEFALRMLATL
eukprot:TRINITY_DN80160_c0_g1_i1.p1 TRINITY_DN80160_c0_g1~~TRINITY_DN80160_c0_g1_i1.p1  ORF type:complete len:303 (-),score=65.15 TRINITY_DN80160_c0_g1_i1:155-1063(-)